MYLEKEKRKTKRWLSHGHLRENEREEGQEKPGKGQQRKRGSRWGDRAGGQQRKPPGTGQGVEICASPYAPRGGKRIDEMMNFFQITFLLPKLNGVD